MSERYEPTPGPWEWDSQSLAEVAPGSEFEVYVPEILHPIARAVLGAANARLIAAAPDLLEACRFLDLTHNDVSAEAAMEYGSAVQKAREAMAKALGR